MIFQHKRQKGKRERDASQDLRKPDRMASITHQYQKDHRGQDTNGLE